MLRQLHFATGGRKRAGHAGQQFDTAANLPDGAQRNVRARRVGLGGIQQRRARRSRSSTRSSSAPPAAASCASTARAHRRRRGGAVGSLQERAAGADNRECAHSNGANAGTLERHEHHHQGAA